MRRRLVRAVVALTALTPAASALGDCADPSWDVPALVALLSTATPADGTALADRRGGKAFTLALEAQATAALEAPPERPPRGADPHAGRLDFSAGAAGRYAVALSDAAWIDIAQDGALVPSGDFLGVHDCPGFRKVVAFDLGPGPFTVQVSDAASESITLAVVPRQ